MRTRWSPIAAATAFLGCLGLTPNTVHATVYTFSLPVMSDEVQIVSAPNHQKTLVVTAPYPSSPSEITLFDGDSVDATVTFSAPVTVEGGGAFAETLFAGLFGSFITGPGIGTSRFISVTLTGVSGDLLVSKFIASSNSVGFSGNLTDTSFNFTGVHLVETVQNPTLPSRLETQSSAYVEVTATDVQMAGASVCGDGIVNTFAEMCDEGVANGTAQSCCTASCTLQPMGRVCRAAASTCDIAEVCDGSNGACPENLVSPDGTSCDDHVFCNGPDACLAGACAQHENLPAGTPCTAAGGPGGCDGRGLCVASTCGNGFVEPAEQCDGGECCAANCRFKGPTEPCGAETRVCHEQPLCNGREATCPQVERLAGEGSICSDGDVCTLTDTCHQGDCQPGQRVCAVGVQELQQLRVKRLRTGQEPAARVTCQLFGTAVDGGRCRAEGFAEGSSGGAVHAAVGDEEPTDCNGQSVTRSTVKSMPTPDGGVIFVIKLNLNRLGREALANLIERGAVICVRTTVTAPALATPLPVIERFKLVRCPAALGGHRVTRLCGDRIP